MVLSSTENRKLILLVGNCILCVLLFLYKHLFYTYTVSFSLKLYGYKHDMCKGRASGDDASFKGSHTQLSASPSSGALLSGNDDRVTASIRSLLSA